MTDEERARWLIAEWSLWCAAQPLGAKVSDKEDDELARMMAEAFSAVRADATKLEREGVAVEDLELMLIQLDAETRSRLLAPFVSAARESALREAWIPCAERMPNKGEPVLFVLYGNTRCAGFFDGEHWRDETDPDHFGKPARERVEDVTHWTPLPELPAPPPTPKDPP